MPVQSPHPALAQMDGCIDALTLFGLWWLKTQALGQSATPKTYCRSTRMSLRSVRSSSFSSQQAPGLNLPVDRRAVC
ncbi:hypothetical protein DFH27DRAFT_258462 [Peziza echinospora]|nr:hypothetical protein DFH27DRAFT_258462 [Peziza echinospora]